MSYYSSMHPSLDPPTPVLTFPVSSSRDEPHTAYPSSSSSQRYDPLGMLATPPPFPPLNPDYAKFAVKRLRQIFPGILEDGCLTKEHKFVDIYLAKVARAPNDRYAHRLEPDNFFGEKRREYQSVADLLGITQPLSQKQNDCIFTLAALKVFHTPHHPAHFTFWGKEACKKTAEKVQNILNMSPCPISAPFGWLGISENVWLVDGIQAVCFPPRPASKKPNGMTLRKRKAREISKDEGDAAVPLPDRTRVKRVRTATAAKPSNGEACATPPLRQSARLATSGSTPQVGNARLPNVAANATPTTTGSSGDAKSKETKMEQISESSLADGAESGLLFQSHPTAPSPLNTQVSPSSLTGVNNLNSLADLVMELTSPTSESTPALRAPTTTKTNSKPSDVGDAPTATATTKTKRRQAATPPTKTPTTTPKVGLATIPPSVPVPTRRSGRQPKPTSKVLPASAANASSSRSTVSRLSTPASSSLSPDPTPASLPESLPEENETTVNGEDSNGSANASMRRARSSSSAKSVDSSVTAVSEGGAGDTAVEDSPEIQEKKLGKVGEDGDVVTPVVAVASKTKGKRAPAARGRKRKLDDVDQNVEVEKKTEDDEEKEKEKGGEEVEEKTRSSGRRRKGAAGGAAASVKAKATQTQASARRGAGSKGRAARKP